MNSNYQFPINIGNPNEYSIIKLVEIIQNLTSSKSNIKYFELPENDPKIRKPDIELASKNLGWNPKIVLLEGLEKTINYFSNYKRNI